MHLRLTSISAVAIVLLCTSCTAYKHSYKPGDDSAFDKDQLTDLEINDKVHVRLKTGQQMVGRVQSISEEFIVVGKRRIKS